MSKGDGMPTVGVLGLGRMGAAMAGRLTDSGFDVVVWNRTPDRTAEVAASVGCRRANSPAEVARLAEVVVSSLADDTAVDEVHRGEEGTLAGASASTVLVETSTVDPATITALAAECAGMGASLLDAPVSGSVSLVQQGSLTSMVGGDASALDRARPVLDVLSAKVFHLGENGTGATMKLAVNALVHATNLAISEALVLAERAGLDRQAAYEVFASGAAASPFVLYKRPAFEQPETTPVAFSLDLVRKDLDLILGLARRLSVPMDQGDVTAAVVDRAIAEGMGQHDMSALAVLLREGAHRSGA